MGGCLPCKNSPANYSTFFFFFVVDGAPTAPFTPPVTAPAVPPTTVPTAPPMGPAALLPSRAPLLAPSCAPPTMPCALAATGTSKEAQITMTDDRNFIWSSRREQNCDESSTPQRAFIDLNQSGWLDVTYRRYGQVCLSESVVERYARTQSVES